MEKPSRPSLKVLLGQLHLPVNNVEISLITNWTAHQFDKDGIEQEKLETNNFLNRTEVWFFKDGQKREISSEISCIDKTSSAEARVVVGPYEEHIYDNRQLLRVFAEDAEVDEPLSMSIDFDPAPIYANGLWANGLLPFWGLTPAQCDQEWNLSELITRFRYPDASTSLNVNRNENDVVVSADTVVGSVKIGWASPNWALDRIEVESSRPSDFTFGNSLSHYKISRIKQEFFDFRYGPNKDSLLRGLKGFRFREERTLLNGRKFLKEALVEIENCRYFESAAPNLAGKLDLAIPVPDGQHVGVLDNINISCIYKDGQIVKLVPKDLEKMIREAIANYRNSGAKSDVWHVSEDNAGLCGISSLFAAACFVDSESSFTDFYEPRYCSNGFGSSASELILAATDRGLFSYPLAGVDANELSKLNIPALLHVRPRGYSETFSHWVLFLRKSSDGVVVFDPAYGIEEMDESEFAARFSGTAIGVARAPKKNVQAELFSNRCLFALAIAISVVFGTWLTNWISRTGQIRAAILTILVCIGMGFVFHAIRKDGLIRGRQIVVQRLAAASSIKFPQMTMHELESTLELESANDSLMLVDCRYHDGFSRGTIRGAVNYPLNIGVKKENQLIKRLEECEKVVLFCQSAKCPYSEMIARRLHYSGIKNIYVLAGGFHEWGNRK